VRAVNHDGLLLSLLGQGVLGLLDVLLVKVGAVAAPAQDHEAVGVALGPGNGGQTLLGDTEEVVLGRGGANGVDRDAQVAVGAVLEPHGEGKTGGKLSVQLGLGGARADGADRDEVGQELGGDGVEHFRGDGHTPARQVHVHLARDAQTLVDLETVVDVRVVNEALPADGGAGLLEVGAHDDAEVAGELVRQLLEPVAVLEGGGGVVDGARADDDEQAVVVAHDDALGLATALDDGLQGGIGGGELGDEQARRDERVLALDCKRKRSMSASCDAYTSGSGRACEEPGLRASPLGIRGHGRIKTGVVSSLREHVRWGIGKNECIPLTSSASCGTDSTEGIVGVCIS
jgi:hypothetical protein